MPRRTSALLDPRVRADPYPLYQDLRAESPVCRTTLPGGEAVFLVTRFADVEAGLKDPRLVKNIRNARDRAPGLLARLGFAEYFSNTNMLKADPPEHTRLRALVHQAFTPKLVNQMRGHVQEVADRLVDAVAPRGRMDLIADFALPGRSPSSARCSASHAKTTASSGAGRTR